MRNVLLICFFLWIFVGQVWAWKVQVPEIFEQQRINIPDGCLIAEWEIVCKESFQDEAEHLSAKMTALRQRLIDLDSTGQRFRADILRGTIRQATPIIRSMHLKSTSAKKRFQTHYVYTIFKDINAFYDKKNTAITVVLNANLNKEEQKSNARSGITVQLISRWWTDFVQVPYHDGQWAIVTKKDNWEDWKVTTTITDQDDLDKFLDEALASSWVYEIVLSSDIYEQWGPLFLFKNDDQLRLLWYDVISHRTRINTDAEYRRENIARSFKHIGTVRVLNAWETVNFLEASNFDPSEQNNYLNGKVIFLDEEVDGYGWWLCWWSTALYQGTLLNTALEISSRNHTKRYSSLYTATINGELINIPWLDSTIYSPSLDLSITNNAHYPIILVADYSGEYWDQETIFTLWMKEARWSAHYLSSYPRAYSIQQKDWEPRDVVWKCFTWLVNWQEKRSCYKEVF